jgi:PhnB protein
MQHPIPYLSFNGTCAEAMRCYERALGGRLELLLKNADTPMAAQLPKEYADRIVHARLALPGGGVLFAGDCPPQMPHNGIHGVGLTLNFDTVAQATTAFHALADGGTVSMAPQAMFWAKICGMLTDRFGTPWIVNGQLQAIYANA